MNRNNKLPLMQTAPVLHEGRLNMCFSYLLNQRLHFYQ